ncbi:hypothetical protein C2S51_038651 [Perilla frutescens var. frutescens]|nr:hypothetical protein C2S51_038651 [Perilla frutescens var. frutescens]
MRGRTGVELILILLTQGPRKAADGAQQQSVKHESAREDLHPDNIARLWMRALDVTRTTHTQSGRNGPRMATIHRARARRRAMVDRNIILHHGGFWRGNTYINGIEEYVHVPSGGMTYPFLFDEAIGIVGDDPNLYKYAISTLMLSADEDNMTLDDDEERVNDETSVRNNDDNFSTNERCRTYDQGNDETYYDDDGEEVHADEEADDLDGYCGMHRMPGPPSVSRCETNDVQNDAFEISCGHGRQWIIPRALYQAVLPLNDLGIDLSVNTRDTLCLGATFSSKDSMITSLGLYHLLNQVEYRIERSLKTRFSVLCRHKERCTFSMRASAQGEQWRVFQWDVPHSCQEDFCDNGQRTIASKIIGAYFAPDLLDEGKVLKPKEMRMKLQREFGVRVDYTRALVGRNHAIRMIYGDSDKSFQLLPPYLYMLEQSNPGSVVELQTDAVGQFEYVYMALAASINGFASYGRSVIVVDGTHLKGKYKGIMFVAATKDGNEQIYPLVVGIGDKENDVAWIWFLRQLRRTYGCRDDMMFVSDQHKSIKNAVAAVYPEITHGICVYHLQNNIKKWGPNVVAMFQKAANCYRTQEFEKHMRNISIAFENGAYKRLLDADPIRWAPCKSPVRRYEFMTSNCAECLNGRLRWARRLPVCTLLECVRTLIGCWFYKRRKNALGRSHPLTQYAVGEVTKSIEQGKTMTVQPISAMKFKVTSGMKHYTVDLSVRKCSCLEFDLNLIPCPYAAAAISKANQHPYAYVNSYYSTENLGKMYSAEVFPVAHPDEWNIPLEMASRVVLAPPNPRQAGRPRMSRIRSASQLSSGGRWVRARCARCGQSGHNRATCTEFIPISEGSQVGSNEFAASNTIRARRPHRCGIYRGSGHTQTTCPNRGS